MNTRWSAVAALMACGIVAAGQIGKAAAALPVLQGHFTMSLAFAALNMSIISLIGALGGGLIGTLVPKIGYRRQLQIGLAVLVAMSLGGAATQHSLLLLMTRAGEGLGFILVILAVPEGLRSVSALTHRRLVMGMWGAYMPLGTGLATLLSPFVLSLIGWQGLWVAGATSALLALIAVTVMVPSAAEPADRTTGRSLRALRAAATTSEILVLSAVFGLYAAQFLAVLGLLPTMLVRDVGMSVATAGMVTAVAFLANAPGNLLAALLQHRGAPWASLIIAGSVFMGVLVWPVYDESQPASVRVLAAIMFSFAGGLVPSAIFGGISAVVGDKGSLGVSTGVLMQGSSVGQLLGPPLVAALAVTWLTPYAEPAVLCLLAGLAVIGGFVLWRATTDSVSKNQRAQGASGHS